MEEIWKPIPNYEGLYEVSNLGNVKSLGNDKTRKEKILKNRVNGKGYYQVELFKYCKSKTIAVHQLVTMAFFNHTPCGYALVVDHINNIKTDNRVENLQLITQRENTSKSNKFKTSRFIGVNWEKQANKWKVKITINGKQIHLGRFNCELAAHLAYQNKLKTIS